VRSYRTLVPGSAWNRIRSIIAWRATVFLAYVWRRLLFGTTFVAVSGSVGKTTTKELVVHILGERFATAGTPGNWNHRRFVGIERTVLKVRPWHRFAIVEVGIERPGDMRSAAAFLKPDIAVMLNVKHCHTKEFRTLEAIAEEKSALLRNLRRNAIAVINQDDPLVAAMGASLECRVVRFGSDPEADFRVVDAQSRWPRRLALTFESNAVIHEVQTQLVGTHWTSSVMASLATAAACGMPIDLGAKAIGSKSPFWARMQPLTLEPYGATVIRDEFNGSVDTFDAALKVLEEAAAPRKIAVFSYYSDSKKEFRRRANHIGRMAGRLADVAIFVGDYAERSVRAAIAEGLPADRTHGFFSTADAIVYLRSTLRAGDLVMIKGLTSHHLSRIYLGLLEPVACTRLVCAKQFLCDRCQELGFSWKPRLAELMAPPDLY